MCNALIFHHFQLSLSVYLKGLLLIYFQQIQTVHLIPIHSQGLSKKISLKFFEGVTKR